MTIAEPQNDPLLPNLVWARAPSQKVEWVTLLIDPATIRTWMEMGGTAKIAEYNGLVHGRFGDEGPIGTTGLKRPIQIHKGLRRPLNTGSADIGRDIHIYVTEPPHTYRYPTRSYDQFPVVEPKPIQSVFTTFVSFDRALIDETVAAMRRPPSRTPDGVVRYWEWTVAPEGAGANSFIRGYEEQLL